MKWSCFIVRRFYEAFCGDAAKYEAHLAMHEAALRAMKQSLTASFRHFFGKKNGGERGIRTLGTLRYTAFPMRRLRPLNHLSAVGVFIRYHAFSVFSSLFSDFPDFS